MKVSHNIIFTSKISFFRLIGPISYVTENLINNVWLDEMCRVISLCLNEAQAELAASQVSESHSGKVADEFDPEPNSTPDWSLVEGDMLSFISNQNGPDNMLPMENQTNFIPVMGVDYSEQNDTTGTDFDNFSQKLHTCLKHCIGLDCLDGAGYSKNTINIDQSDDSEVIEIYKRYLLSYILKV